MKFCGFTRPVRSERFFLKKTEPGQVAIGPGHADHGDASAGARDHRGLRDQVGAADRLDRRVGAERRR